MRIMNKIVALGALILLTGCTSVTPSVEDKIAPVFSGVPLTATISANTEYDALSNVTVNDNVDGDLTSKIKVSTMPELTVLNGKITPLETGDYEIIYSVIDDAENIAKAYTTLTVTAETSVKEIYKEFDFTQKSTHDWKLTTLSSSAGTLDIENGKLVLDATSSKMQADEVKLAKMISVVNEGEYSITYEFTSTAAGNISLNGETKSVVIGNNTISHEFVSTTDSTELELKLEAGLLADEFTLEFTRMSLHEEYGQAVFTDVMDEDYDYSNSDNVIAQFNDGSSGTLTSTTTDATINITASAPENGVWQIKLFLSTGLTLEANVDYYISYSLNSTAKFDLFETIFNSGSEEKGIGAIYGQSLEANTLTKFGETVNNSTEKKDLVVGLQLGQLSNNATPSVTISELKVEKVTGDQVVNNDDMIFTPSGFSTHNENGQAEGFIYEEGKNLVYQMNKIGVTDWHNKLTASKISLEKDKLYTFEFTASASADISCAFFVNLEGKWQPLLSESPTITTSELTFSFTAPRELINNDSYELLWQFGSQDNSKLGPITVIFSSLTIYSQVFVD